MKKALLLTVALVIMVAGASSATATNQEKVTLCHAAGLDGTTHYVELTVGWNAAYGPAGHFYENGTPRAGHEDDYLGPCQTEEETHLYRVVAGMPRFRGELFEAPVESPVRPACQRGTSRVPRRTSVAPGATSS